MTSGKADDVVAVPQRVGERDHGAEIVSHHRQRSVDAELVADEVVKVGGHGPFVVAIAGLGGSTSAAVVGHDDLVACGHTSVGTTLRQAYPVCGAPWINTTVFNVPRGMPANV